MTPHIEAKKGDYYPTVLMPGDPLRAKYIAENFLTDAICVNSVRNCLGYSGKYKGKGVSVQASGMGQPSLGIYAHELYNFYDVKSIIRVGSCGGINSSLKLGDIVVALTSSTDSSMTQTIAPGFLISPCCDYILLKNFMDVCPVAHVGAMVSNDYYYQPNKNWFKPLIDMGILAVDMETHVLYSIAMKSNKQSLSVNTVSDHLQGGKEMSSKERETGLNNMIQSVLDSL
jgi:purine-nucleoside phosphorylase